MVIIGMDYIPDLISKEGGYIRTGSRTPMQWNNEKNHGFSKNDIPYLPTDIREGSPTVESQINNEKSLLSFVRELILLHKTNSALWAEAEFDVLETGYPFVFKRFTDKNCLIIVINPSDKNCTYNIISECKVLLSQNVKMAENKFFMNGVSFVVAEITT